MARRSKRAKVVAEAAAATGNDDEEEQVEVAVATVENEPTAAAEQPHDPQQPSPAKFQRGQKVLARDSDGLLYTAVVRRSLCGIQHQHKLDCLGTIAFTDADAEETNAAAPEQTPNKPKWFYFVHFLAWKVNWDRWVAEDDMFELSDETERWQRRIQEEHRALQLAFQKKSKKIDGGAFLKAWKPKLESVWKELLPKENEQGRRQERKKRTSSEARTKQKKHQQEQDLLVQKQSLTISRSANEIEQLAIPFQLKRILVEEWEVLNGDYGTVLDMEGIPTVRQILNDYLKSKGVDVEQGEAAAPGAVEADKDSSPSSDMPAANTEGTVSTDATPMEEDVAVAVAAAADTSPDSPTADLTTMQQEPKELESSSPVDEVEKSQNDKAATPPAADADNNDDPKELERKRRQKEWTDMANGICQLFDQALPYRLLYPSEQPQLSALLEAHSKTPASDQYGAAHMLRLFCQLPSLLTHKYGADEEVQQVLVKPMLAKVNDLLRFLHKNQDQYFVQKPRKMTAEELKYKDKWVKRFEKRKRSSATMAEDEELE